MKATKLTSKYQATIPKEVREKLHLKAGDSIVFQFMNDGSVIIKKVRTLDIEYLKALNQSLTEWSSEDDDAAFEHLQHL
jgi:antitoxin PrlF